MLRASQAAVKSLGLFARLLIGIVLVGLPLVVLGRFVAKDDQQDPDPGDA